jgi:hypothetical protein
MDGARVRVARTWILTLAVKLKLDAIEYECSHPQEGGSSAIL